MENFDLTKFLAEGKLYEADNKSVLRTLIQDLEPFEYEVYAFDAEVDPEDGAQMEEYIASLSDMEVSSEISKLKGINEDKTEDLDENAASNLELKNVAKQLFLGFKKMGADVELATNTVTLNKKPADGNMDSKNVFLYAGDDVVEVTLVGEKAIGFFDPIKKDFSQFEFIDKGDGKTWNNQKTKSLNIIPGKTTSESLNESVVFPMWNKIK